MRAENQNPMTDSEPTHHWPPVFFTKTQQLESSPRGSCMSSEMTMTGRQCLADAMLPGPDESIRPWDRHTTPSLLRPRDRESIDPVEEMES